MGFFDTVLNMGEKLVSKAQENMAKIEEYKESYSNLCDKELLDELNQQRRKKDNVFNDNAHFRIKALGLLLQERGYYYAGDGKIKKCNCKVFDMKIRSRSRTTFN